MGLKKDRYVKGSHINYWFNTAATRGGIASVVTGGSGVCLDNQGTASSPKPLAAYVANSSGAKPLGVLWGDTVDIDTTKFHTNFYKDEHDIPCKVNLINDGWMYTNFVVGTPADGDPAYLGSSGNVQTTANGAANNPRVGTFRGSKDADGYVKLELNLPY